MNKKTACDTKAYNVRPAHLSNRLQLGMDVKKYSMEKLSNQIKSYCQLDKVNCTLNMR
jgi:hypothetical protein